MIKKLTAHGNSAALIIDKPILELLRISMNTPLELSTDGKKLIISPVGENNREEDIKVALERINLRRKNTVKKAER
ncbi:MAG TPA: AbrB/MazE/SpoVT family DNA-binding domain-containing protein [Thermodesulfovibrionia bacterium]|jgi:antitoxin component of MazEF toxin-antitoxin module|nr:AbrB/MazE/SpoVT family DNA-binding domain-containing protein [Thermodesulfovibrionia bacterium]